MGTPERTLADVVPAPPWWTMARHSGNTAEWLIEATTFTWSVSGMPATSQTPVQIRGPFAEFCTDLGDHRDRVGGESTGMLPQPK